MSDRSAIPDPIASLDRIREISDLRLLAPDVQDGLQRLVEEAAARLELPTGLVSVVLNSAQHFAASHGLAPWLEQIGGTPIEWSFCANSVRTRAPFVVTDATTDPRVQHNPMVVREGVRCYAGVPLISARGEVLGNLCVVGSSPREFSEQEIEILQELARTAMEFVESRRSA